MPDTTICLRLIRGYLAAGVLDGGLFEASREGTPQGEPGGLFSNRGLYNVEYIWE
ncbi:MAG TPA: hypothetical protein VNV39_10160 [Stellaceae bacterium]|nr:hypothetical protein [Stellaceae bacterium]